MRKKLFFCLTAAIAALTAVYLCTSAQKSQLISKQLSTVGLDTETISEMESALENRSDEMDEYIYSMSVMNIPDSDSTYLNELIREGFGVSDVMSVYKFYRGTDCELSSVRKVLELKDSFKGDTWIENCYNYITDDKYGVLEYEDVCEYLKEGLDVSDILAANSLCRRGVYTIDEILETYKSDRSWSDIYSDIEHADTGMFSPEKTAEDIIDIMYLKTNYGVSEDVISALDTKEKREEFIQDVTKAYENALESEVTAE